jgi:hypothetical protein
VKLGTGDEIDGRTFVAKLVVGTAGTVGRLYAGAGIESADDGCNMLWLA